MTAVPDFLEYKPVTPYISVIRAKRKHRSFDTFVSKLRYFLGYVDKKDTHAHGANRIEAHDYINETVKIAHSITENAFI